MQPRSGRDARMWCLEHPTDVLTPTNSAETFVWFDPYRWAFCSQTNGNVTVNAPGPSDSVQWVRANYPNWDDK